jgi:hypothetical protein
MSQPTNLCRLFPDLAAASDCYLPSHPCDVVHGAAEKGAAAESVACALHPHQNPTPKVSTYLLAERHRRQREAAVGALHKVEAVLLEHLQVVPAGTGNSNMSIQFRHTERFCRRTSAGSMSNRSAAGTLAGDSQVTYACGRSPA